MTNSARSKNVYSESFPRLTGVQGSHATGHAFGAFMFPHFAVAYVLAIQTLARVY